MHNHSRTYWKRNFLTTFSRQYPNEVGVLHHWLTLERDESRGHKGKMLQENSQEHDTRGLNKVLRLQRIEMVEIENTGEIEKERDGVWSTRLWLWSLRQEAGGIREWKLVSNGYRPST